MKTLHTLLVFLGLLLFTSSSVASPPTRYTGNLDAGGAYITIDAPLLDVNKHVIDYETYTTLFRRFNKITVVKRTNTYTDVLFQMPLKFGWLPFIPKSLWCIVRFSTRSREDVIVVRGFMLDGNMETITVRYVMRKIDDTKTKLNVELLIIPNFPVPRAYMRDELTDAAEQISKKIAEKSETKK